MGTYSGQLLSITALTLITSACSHSQSINFSVIKESNQCRISTQTISKLSGEEQEKFAKTLSGFANPDQEKSLKQLFQRHAESETLFLVSQGQKSSAGYGFEIISHSGTLVNNTLRLPISFTSPEPGSMRAQVMTSPCLIFGIDATAQYNLLVIDSLELHVSE